MTSFVASRSRYLLHFLMKIEQALAAGEASRHSDSGVGVYLSFATEIVIQFRHCARVRAAAQDIYQQMIVIIVEGRDIKHSSAINNSPFTIPFYVLFIY